jgi:hypothetical protein
MLLVVSYNAHGQRHGRARTAQEIAYALADHGNLPLACSYGPFQGDDFLSLAEMDVGDRTKLCGETLELRRQTSDLLDRALGRP